MFRVGDVFVRHGTRSERWTDADRRLLVEQIVARRKDSWRREAFAEWTARLDLGLAAHRVQASRPRP
ncbi:hypothetical protein CLV40_111202 [Actinokineospora auranticolor]|uniref:Uncharacterized protein n=1 Tax=Actinokineospora auranticolor TaxID=155976 RepID=A0A2S6GLY1_9PSEU|nr:hypothetical protein CLV40_111202 [Actinokineospora auranticolor]